MAVSVFGQYELKSEIGRSRLGIVYLAVQASLEREVALRIVSPDLIKDEATRQNIFQRLTQIAHLQHPAIVPIYDFGEIDGQVYIASRFMSGGSLATRLEKHAVQSWDLLSLLKPITSAIDYAHNLGIIHGDIRPSNILFDEDRASIADFSFFPTTAPSTTDTGANFPITNSYYLSPEQIKGEPVQPASDIYSLGIIAFEVLAGHPPFRADTAIKTALQHLNEPVPHISHSPTVQTLHIQQVLDKALAKQAQNRFSSASEFGEAIIDQIAPKASAKPPAPAPQPSPAPPSPVPHPPGEEAFEEPAPMPPAPRPAVEPFPTGAEPPPGREESRPPSGRRRTSSPRPTRKPAAPTAPVVNTGFALPGRPGSLLNPRIPLKSQSSYYFCLGVGKAQANSSEITPVRLPESLPVGAELRVALFSFPGEIEIDPQASVGTLRLGEGGTAKVEQQPGQSNSISDLPWLVFPVKTPAKTGRWRLRCSMYYKQFLVQSRLVTVEVRKSQVLRPWKVLRSILDYNLTQSLSARHLSGMKAHRLSLMINDNGNGTHGFRFFGEQDFKSDAALDGQELQELIELARKGLRLAAWGDENFWKDQPYRYGGTPDPKRFFKDLVTLAVRGYRIYDQLINRLAGGSAQASQLAEIMRSSGLVQVALKQDARHVLPAAMIYDYPFDTAASLEDYRLCEQFQEALESDKALQECGCFHGECPSREDEVTLCPSGFWGFRHEIGLPLSLADAPDAPTIILANKKLDLILSVSLDPAFVLRQEHEDRLHNLFLDANWKRAADRQTTFKVMQEAQSHLVYFYCHGGLNASNIPYILVGPLTERGITRDNLRLKKIVWNDPRPLVFINGCHTAALEPESAFELVSGFIETAGASGVIGTEITVFEPLATAFAESFLKAFGSGIELGEAVRIARLALLKQMNPLGLAYIPFAMANLSLKFHL